ncbi:tudor and KH domain-containing protein isoform X1 [Vespula squamosa]|uniref:Tudor and KH domain-containing protein isoform X1 n=1 Tax=Vespula squamosa TaxID=30214 RepID=A0ABD2BNQ9_VESSQ
MNIIPMQYFLSTLVGISFTSLSLALIYCWYKDDDRTKNILHIVQHKLKKDIKVKRKCVPALIGKAGSIIKDIQNKSETWINFKDDDLQYSYRTCTIAGTKEGIDLAEAMIQNIIADHALIETYEMYIPVNECRKIIGICENTEKEIHMSTKIHANITVEKALNQSDNKQKIIINGTANQIANVIHYIESKVLEQKYREKEISSYANKLGIYSVSTQLALFSYDNIIDVDIYITDVKNIQTIHFRLISEDESLIKLHLAMADYYKILENRQSNRLKVIKRGQIVTAKCKNDGCWYRAEILEVYFSYVSVHYIDFGTICMIHQKNILNLDSKFTYLRAQAIECELIYIQPISDKMERNEIYNTAVGSRKKLRARIRGYKRRELSLGKLYPVNSPCPLIELFDEEYSIKQCNIDPEIMNNEFDLNKEIYVDSDDEQYEHRSYKPQLCDHSPVKYAIKNDENGGWYSAENSEDEYYENKDWYCQNGLQEEFYKNGGWNNDRELFSEEDQEQGEEGKKKRKYEMDGSEVDESEVDESKVNKSDKKSVILQKDEEEDEEQEDDDDETRDYIKKLREEEKRLEFKTEMREQIMNEQIFGRWSMSRPECFTPGDRLIKLGRKIIFDVRSVGERVIEKREERRVIRVRKIKEFRKQRKIQRGIISADDNNESDEETMDIDYESKYSGPRFLHRYIPDSDLSLYDDVYDVSQVNNKKAENIQVDTNEISNHNNHKKEHDENRISNHKNDYEERNNQNGISDHKNDNEEQYSTKFENPELNNSSHVIPAGFESDISEEFDGFELG